MRLLLDAHTLIWAVDDPARLERQARAALEDSENELLVSAGTIWELSIKVGLGKLTLSSPFLDWINKATETLSVSILPITAQHCAAQANLSLNHRDPFDRLLVAQAKFEGASVVSADPALDQYGISRVW